MNPIQKLVLLSCMFFIGLGYSQKTAHQKKVVFIIVDGIAEDMLQKAEIPNLNRIAKDGAFLPAYVGGEKGGYSETPTISAVGYNSLLTGTWLNKHNVDDNDIKAPNYHYPTIFKIFKDQYPDKKIAVFSTWEDNRTKLIGEHLPETRHLKMDYSFDGFEKDTLRFPHDDEKKYIKNIDSLVAHEAAYYIKTKAPDLSWVYLEYTDDMGHRYGDSKQMYDAISYEDRLIGQIYNAVKAREAEHDEDWLFIVTTDHGRTANTGQGHGGQSNRERNTWIYINQPNINSYAKNKRVAVTDIFPTIANFLKISIPAAIKEELDGVDLLQPIAAYHLKAKINSNLLTVTWTPTLEAKGIAKILVSTTNHFKNDGKDKYQLLGKTDVQNGTFSIKLQTPPQDFYKIILQSDNGYLNTWIKR